jgi:hypothetical protein
MDKKESLFRLLRADEIECRVGTVKENNGVSLLLYKDARCDMNILDETVGANRWARKHYECKGNLFCSVGIEWDGAWVFKDDCGTESNTEKEKGEASDSFKRSCVNWGIGRELYTAPFIWVDWKQIKVTDKNKVVDKFSCASIDYDSQRRISALSISNCKGDVVYTMNAAKNAAPKDKPDKSEVKCSKCGAVIRSAVGKDGKEYSPSEVAGKCKGMCKTCFLEAQNES